MPDRYAVIGHPIAHSKSPLIHGLFAQATEQDMTYEAIDGGAEPGGFERALGAFRAAGGRGMNVTLPFKLQALAVADAASEDARLAGAANALRFEDGRVEAQNFDGIGLVRDIERNLGLPLAGKRVLLLGAGGAAAGALAPLLAQAPAQLVISNRTQAKADALVAQHADLAALYKTELLALTGQALEGNFDIIINATASSLQGAATPAPAHTVRPGTLVYDMMYGPAAAPFLQWAAQLGAVPRDGLGMLVEQAAEAFWLWRGVRPPSQPVLAQVRAEINA